MERATVRYEPPERPPNALAFGMGFQQAALCYAGIVITPVVVVRQAGGGEPYLSWAVFAALFISGLTTILQSVRLGPVGAGYPLLMGTSGVFIAVSVAALAEGGPGLLATLVLCSAAGQFVLARRLALLRQIITPTVAGTVIMLIAVTVMPFIFDLLSDLPPGVSPADVRPEAGPVCAGITLLVIACLALRAEGWLRLWVPVIGLLTGSVTGAFYGIYDTATVADASWIGLPDLTAWPLPDLAFDARFWSLLPLFMVATWIGAIETVGDASAVQDVAWRRKRATDYREVQGAVTADGIGNVLAGIFGTVPNTTYSTSVSVTELTGIAARSVGVWIGVLFIAAAFLPKAAAVVLAIPGPVVAAFLVVLIGMLFVLGMRMVLREVADYRNAVIVGVSFWVGSGFQNQAIFGDLLGGWWADILGNGMASGGLTAILLTLFMHLTRGRKRRLRAVLNAEALPEVDDFLRELATRAGWGEEAAARLRSAGEEAAHCLIGSATPQDDDRNLQDRRLLVTARAMTKEAELEFLVAPGPRNVEDSLVLLGDVPADGVERELSLRLLRHYATAIRHQQYRSVDVLSMRVPGGSE